MSTSSTDLLIIDIIGYSACVLTVICLIPQLFKLYKTKSSADISITTYVGYLMAQILWMIL